MIDSFNQNIPPAEVYHAQSSCSKFTKHGINSLIFTAEKNERKRSRFCVHESIDETVHEMIIVHSKNTYVRPHKHINKSESMLVIDGLVDYYTFDFYGNVVSVDSMGAYSSGKIFYVSNRNSSFHSIIIHSDWLVFLEITQGPFDKSDTIFAPWSPVENCHDDVEIFLNTIKRIS
jgi:cupin fold WbuC family metalloprotein